MVTINSLSDRLAGWRLGWMAGSEAALRLRAGKQAITICTTAVSTMGGPGVGEVGRGMMENPNIPQEVRAVAADGTQLRYALMEMAREMHDVITLGRGDPDLPTPPHIVEAAKRAMRAGLTGATDVRGMSRLRHAIAEHMGEVNGLALNSENVMVTTGGQEGLFLAVQALINPGDEVLVPDPRYSSYDDAIKRAGGRMVMVPTDRHDAFNLQAEAVEAAVTPASKALLIVTPSNPTAGIVTEDRLRAIAEVAIRHNLIVIVDEIYGKVVYPPWRHFSIGSLPGMAERTITLDAFSKAYAMTGWRCGYAAAPADVIDAMARIKQVTTGPVATISQWAGLAAMTGPQDCVREYLDIYIERRRVLLRAWTAWASPMASRAGVCSCGRTAHRRAFTPPS